VADAGWIDVWFGINTPRIDAVSWIQTASGAQLLMFATYLPLTRASQSVSENLSTSAGGAESTKSAPPAAEAALGYLCAAMIAFIPCAMSPRMVLALVSWSRGPRCGC
jgi:hypothetical protein